MTDPKQAQGNKGNIQGTQTNKTGLNNQQPGARPNAQGQGGFNKGTTAGTTDKSGKTGAGTTGTSGSTGGSTGGRR